MSAYHKVIGAVLTMQLVSLFMFDLWYTLPAAGLFIGFNAGVSFVLGVSLNYCLLTVPKPDQIFSWFSISNGCFGVGALVAPLMVDLFTLHAYTTIGIIVLPAIFFYLFVFKSVEEIRKENMQ